MNVMEAVYNQSVSRMVAWTDRDWYLREQNVVYLDNDLATILVRRGTARLVNLSQSRQTSILTERGCCDTKGGKTE